MRNATVQEVKEVAREFEEKLNELSRVYISTLENVGATSVNVSLFESQVIGQQSRGIYFKVEVRL